MSCMYLFPRYCQGLSSVLPSADTVLSLPSWAFLSCLFPAAANEPLTPVLIIVVAVATYFILDRGRLSTSFGGDTCFKLWPSLGERSKHTGLLLAVYTNLIAFPSFSFSLTWETIVKTLTDTSGTVWSGVQKMNFSKDKLMPTAWARLRVKGDSWWKSTSFGTQPTMSLHSTDVFVVGCCWFSSFLSQICMRKARHLLCV